MSFRNLSLTISRIGPTVAHDDLNPAKEFDADVKTLFATIDNALMKLGLDARDYMRQKITSTNKREGSTGRLEKSIETYWGAGWVGVGYIPDMDVSSPHWYLINYGGMSRPALLGMKVPGYFGNNQPPLSQYAGTGLGRDAFHYRPNESSSDSQGRFFMIPKYPIAPCNYIETTCNWVNQVIKEKYIHKTGWTGKVQPLAK